MAKKRNPDIRVHNEGSIFLIEPLTDKAHEWLKDNAEIENWQWLGGKFGVEHRMSAGLVEGMRGDGLIVV